MSTVSSKGQGHKITNHQGHRSDMGRIPFAAEKNLRMAVGVTGSWSRSPDDSRLCRLQVLDPRQIIQIGNTCVNNTHSTEERWQERLKVIDRRYGRQAGRQAGELSGGHMIGRTNGQTYTNVYPDQSIWWDENKIKMAYIQSFHLDHIIQLIMLGEGVGSVGKLTHIVSSTRCVNIKARRYWGIFLINEFLQWMKNWRKPEDKLENGVIHSESLGRWGRYLVSRLFANTKESEKKEDRS